MTATLTFPDKFGPYPTGSTTLTLEIEGFTLTARVEHDDSGDTPWERDMSHGPVSEWTTRAMYDGERVLSEDHGSYRYYDMDVATTMAQAEGWQAPKGCNPRRLRKYVAAAEHDFDMLKAWCDDRWHYVGVVISVEFDGIMLDRFAASLWGIECDYPATPNNEYLDDVANELISEAFEAGRAKIDHLVHEFLA